MRIIWKGSYIPDDVPIRYSVRLPWVASPLCAVLHVTLAVLNPRPEATAYNYTQLTGLLALVFALPGLRTIMKGSRSRVRLGVIVAGVLVTLFSMYKASNNWELRRTNARQRVSWSKLRELGIAIHNYNSAKGHLPAPAIYSKEGKPLLSWRVSLLHYLEQDALFNQFALDEPWDGPHNLPLLEKMPKIFASPLGPHTAQTITYYQAFVGPGTVFEGTGVRFEDITDGPAETFLVVEAGEPVPWTKPDDLAYNPDQPLPKLGGVTRDGFLACCADGSLRYFPKETPEAVLRALITRNGGETIELK